MKVRDFLKQFLGIQSVMTNDDLSLVMTRVLETFSLMVQTAQIVLNALLIVIFLNENINTSQKLA